MYVNSGAPGQHGVGVGVRPTSHTHRKPSAVTHTAAAAAAATSPTTAGRVEGARLRINAAAVAVAAASLLTAGSIEGARGSTPRRHSCMAASRCDSYRRCRFSYYGGQLGGSPPEDQRRRGRCHRCLSCHDGHCRGSPRTSIAEA
ncbi:hypothetical protein NDU88_001341 [Pleurodeles waltl]|uniref:Uncharacterized protein n=1 Tax=Pleurodeles waltl TaxID=8319 RepID=A0AAV7KQR1_PLEWA|nr:hypothetical protein NDU88_001341 [Pleurodeles waltl]